MSRSPTPRRVADDAPATSENGHVELTEMMTGKAKLPIEEDLMQLARLGEIKAIQNLFDTGKSSASSTDDQGITPLHVCSLSPLYARLLPVWMIADAWI